MNEDEHSRREQAPPGSEPKRAESAAFADDRAPAGDSESSEAASPGESVSAGEAASVGDDDEASVKRRRRGHRGGRRHKSAAAKESEAVADASSADGQMPARPGAALAESAAAAAAGVVAGGKAHTAEKKEIASDKAGVAAPSESVPAAVVPASRPVRRARGTNVEPLTWADTVAHSEPAAKTAGVTAEAAVDGTVTATRLSVSSAEAESGHAAAGAVAADVASEPPAKRRRRRSRKIESPPSGAAPTEAAEVAASPVIAGVAPELAPAALVASEAVRTGSEGTSSEVDGGTAKPRHRRGGRGRSKPATIVAEPLLASVERGAVSAMTADLAEHEADAAVEAAAAAAAAEPTSVGGEAKPKRRRRGGRSHSKAAAAAASVAGGTPSLPGDVAAAAGETSPDSTGADNKSPVATHEPPSDEVAATGKAVGTAGSAAKPLGRSRRGGRKRGATAGSAETAAADAVADAAAEPAAPSVGLSGPQARAEALGVELPKRRRILVSAERSELRVAVVEDDRLAEILIERPNKLSYLGNIYKCKVENVLPGMDAAFIDFGLEKNGFLYVDDVTVGEGEERRGRKITSLLHPGDEVLCQVTKDPMGSKGARLTMKLSLAGRYVVYVVGGSGVGVSRRLPTAERDRLRDLCKSLKVRNAGLIVRTAAEGKGLEELRADAQYLSRLWSRLKAKIDKIKAPGLLYAEVDVALETVRDLFNESYESVIVDAEKQRKEIIGFLDKVAPHLKDRVQLYTDDVPLFAAYGIEPQIANALERRVPLPSGGNLVIDHTEALTVIDVNSGRYTGGKGLEETITKTNLEAAREVVRQLRLRDIGGIIVIDFIDMSYARNREAVLKRLDGELETDRTKTYVVELSPLGLVEMTRQNTTDGARGILTKTCPTCQGKARIISEETMALTVQRRLRDLARVSQAKAWLIELNKAVADRMSVDGQLKDLEKESGKHIFCEGSQSLPVDAFRVVCEGTLAEVEAQRIPVREGLELEVECEFALTYSPRDAVAYVDGYMIIVEGGKPFLGHRRNVRITATSRTGAFATLLAAGTGR
ncbi:MAG: Rne/Rng family ribonuclease [Thermoleophilia bacterium]